MKIENGEILQEAKYSNDRTYNHWGRDVTLSQWKEIRFKNNLRV